MSVIIKFKSNGEDGPETPSYEYVLKMANALTKTSDPGQVSEVLKAAAMAELDPVAADMILGVIQKKIQSRIKPLRQQLRKYEQELGLSANDLALEIARKIRNEHFNGGAHLVRCVDGSYWVFDHTHWRETTGENLRRLILEEATKVSHRNEGNSLTALVGQAKTCLDDLLGTDEDVMGFSDDPLPVVNCANGEVWIEADGSVSLAPHRPESRLTYCLPISYDPAAVCPAYDEALPQIFAEADDPADMVRHWHEFVGYAIQPRRDIATFWLLIGHGNNGKSKLLETVSNLVGPDGVLNDSIASFQRDRFNLAALAGKLLFIEDDLAENVVLDDGLLKKISEAKTISARHAYGRRKFNFRCLALPIMAGNTYPRTKDVSYGLVRRAMIVPFDRVFGPSEDNPKLFPAIWESELPGVLNRALEGLNRLRERGGFKLPTDCERAHAEFLCHANPLMGFIDDLCIVDPDARTRLAEFREALRVWARDQGIRGVPADKRLKRKLEGLGLEVNMVKGYNTVFGLGLKP